MMAMSAVFEVELLPETRAPRVARRVLERRFGGALDGVVLGRAKLLVSELVTNAVLHGHGTDRLPGGVG
jgi:hypothetical protein